MRVKKQIALLLSGAILAGSLAGCSRTIIEHQFHTNIISDTSSVEDQEGSSQIFYDIQSIFEDRDIDTGWTIYSVPTSTEELRNFDGVITEISLDDVQNFVQNPKENIIGLCKKYDPENGMEGYLFALSECVSQFCSEFENEMKYIENGWDTLKQNIYGDDNEVGAQISMDVYNIYDDSENFYVYVSLHKTSNKG